MTDTSDKHIDEVISKFKESLEMHRRILSADDVRGVTELLHAVRSERNMLAYEKGGHTLWKRYTQ